LKTTVSVLQYCVLV